MIVLNIYFNYIFENIFKETEELYTNDPFFKNAINIANNLIEKDLKENFKTEMSSSSISMGINYFDSLISQILFCNNKKTVIVLTNKGTIYKSINEGFKFEKFLFQENKKEKFISMQQNSLYKNSIFFIKNNISYITHNCLNSFNKIKWDSMITKIDFHPKNKRFILVKTKGKCKLKEIKNKLNVIDTKMFCKGDNLYLSKNNGKSFKIIYKNIEDFNWLIFKNSKLKLINRIIVIQFNEDTYEFNPQIYIKNKSIYYSNNYFKTKQIIFNEIDKYVIATNKVYITKLEKNNNNELELYVFKNKYKINVFQVDLPFKFLKHYSYNICYHNKKLTYLHISHHHLHNKFGHLYLSDNNIKEFKLIKKYVARNEDGFIDFEKIKGLDGIVYVNIYLEEDIKSYLLNYQNKDKNNLNYNLQINKITLISYNNGYSWKYLKPKIWNSKNEILNYNNSLNLNFYNDNNYSKFYNNKESVCLILSTGNTGKYLTNFKKELNTFISIDCGKTFKIINNVNSIYEIGNQGGLLLYENNNIKSKEINFSWDYGKTINRIPIYSKKIDIISILINDKLYSNKFLVIATEIYKGREIGTIIPIDFSKFLPRNCNKYDIEKYKIRGRENDCILGEHIIKERRKLDSNCLITHELSNFSAYFKCDCDINDYICDSNYIMENNRCKIIDINKNSEPIVCFDYFYKSNGYKKIPFNNCEGKTKYDKEKIICLKYKKFLIIFIFIFVIISIICLIVWILKKTYLGFILGLDFNWNIIELSKKNNNIKLKKFN